MPHRLLLSFMHHRRAVAACLLFIANLAPATAFACTKLLASGNPEYPPFLWQDPKDDSKLIGANAELMQMLAQEIGLPIEVRYAGPWGRVQESAKSGRIDMIAGAFLTQPRLSYMRYITPAIRDTQSLVWTRKKHKLQYRQFEDLIGFDGITVVNNSFGQQFDQFAASHLKLQQVGSIKNALAMLSRNRADYLIYEDSPGQAYTSSMKIDNLRASSIPVSKEKLYLTLALTSPCNGEILAENIARAMKKFNDERRMDALLVKYIKLWQIQTAASHTQAGSQFP